MAINDLSPAFVTLDYVSLGRSHKMTLPVLPSGSVTPGVEPDILRNNDTAIDFSTAMTTFVQSIDHLFHTGTQFGVATFWSKPTPASDPLWIYADSVDLPGVSATANVAYSQCVLTFRTDLGGLLKLYLMEGWVPVNTRDVPPWAAGFQSVFTDMSGANGFVRGRDGGKIISNINVTAKTNDALRKKFVLDE